MKRPRKPLFVRTLAENLRHYRLEMELRPAELDARAGLPEGAIGIVERGDDPAPPLALVQILADALNLGDRPWVLLTPRKKR